MRKVLFMLALLPMLLLSACSDDEDNNEKNSFNYPIESLYGTWNGVEIDMDGVTIDVTEWPYTKYSFMFSFDRFGYCVASGYFGSGSVTYKTKGDTIYAYDDGEEYMRAQVVSLNNDTLVLILAMDGSNETLKVKMKRIR